MKTIHHMFKIVDNLLYLWSYRLIKTCKINVPSVIYDCIINLNDKEIITKNGYLFLGKATYIIF